MVQHIEDVNIVGTSASMDPVHKVIIDFQPKS